MDRRQTDTTEKHNSCTVYCWPMHDNITAVLNTRKQWFVTKLLTCKITRRIASF